MACPAGPDGKRGLTAGADKTVRVWDLDRAEVIHRLTGHEGEVTFSTSDPTKALHELTGWALDRGVDLAGLTVTRPSLEDVYLRITGSDGVEQ